MLVLSRQRDETIMIGDDIEVTVVDIRGDKVRLGINAPKEVSVHRKEVYEAIRKENREAAQVRPEDISGLRMSQPGSPADGSEKGAGSGPGGVKPTVSPVTLSGVRLSTPGQSSRPAPPPGTAGHDKV